MTTGTLDDPPEEAAPDDAVLAGLVQMRQAMARLVADASDVPAEVRAARITALERLLAATQAAQYAEIVRLGRDRVAAGRVSDQHPRDTHRSLVAELGLACRLSPTLAGRRLTVARDLWFDLPRTYALLAEGSIGDWPARIMVGETSHLDPDTRRQLDSDLAGQLPGADARTVEHVVRKAAYEADPVGTLGRGRTARADRRVTLRPAPDTMTLLTALLPLEQGVACFASLRRQSDATKATGDPRTRDQLMADTLVERLTGQQRAEDVNAEIHIQIPVDALVSDTSVATAMVRGHGPVPAGFVREMLATSQGRLWWRRLFTRPTWLGPAQVFASDPQRRRFDGQVASLVKLRDQHCRAPFCTAPIRHLDHITPYRDGGPTTLAGGQGLCAFHNLVREARGWQITLARPGDPGSPHLTRTRGPSGPWHPSRPPDPP